MMVGDGICCDAKEKPFPLHEVALCVLLFRLSSVFARFE
jgi:hypothetical protein